MAEKKVATGKMGVFSWIVLVIQLALSCALMFFLRNIVPVKYMGIAGAVLVGLVLLLFLGVYLSSKKSRKVLVGIFVALSLIVSVVLGAGLVVVNQGLSTLDSVTEAEYQTQ